MKHWFSLICALLLSLFLIGCGSEDSNSFENPLTTAERNALEKEFFDSMRILVNAKDDHQAEISFTSPKKYDVADLYLMRWNESSNEVLEFFPALSAGTEVLCSSYQSASWYESEEVQGNQYCLSYTIGEYRYRSGPYTLDMTSGTNESADQMVSALVIYLETDTGPKRLNLEGDNSFGPDERITGLTSARIEQMTGSVAYSDYGDYFYNLYFTLVGEEPADGANLVYKLFREDGIIVDIDNALFNENNARLFFGAYLKPGIYTLRFEEK